MRNLEALFSGFFYRISAGTFRWFFFFSQYLGAHVVHFPDISVFFAVLADTSPGAPPLLSAFFA